MSNGTANRTDVVVDLNTLRLTNRDMLDFRREVGKSIQNAFKTANTQEWKDDPDWLAISALSWILGRKNNPGLTLDDCLDAEIDATGLLEYLNVLQAANPTMPVVDAPIGKLRKKSTS